MFKIIFIASLFSLILTLAQSAPSAGLEGVWRAESYRLDSGAQHSLRGHIFFSGDQWTVLFFVLNEEGEPARASAEGGSYRLEGAHLTFIHRYHFSGGGALPGLPEAPFKMEVSETDNAASEPCRVEMGDGKLTIFFPSGNAMRFGR